MFIFFKHCLEDLTQELAPGLVFTANAVLQVLFQLLPQALTQELEEALTQELAEGLVYPACTGVGGSVASNFVSSIIVARVDVRSEPRHKRVLRYFQEFPQGFCALFNQAFPRVLFPEIMVVHGKPCKDYCYFRAFP